MNFEIILQKEIQGGLVRSKMAATLMNMLIIHDTTHIIKKSTSGSKNDLREE